MTRLSFHRFRSNQVRLALSLLAHNPGEFVAAVGVAQANRKLVADQFGHSLDVSQNLYTQSPFELRQSAVNQLEKTLQMH